MGAERKDDRGAVVLALFLCFCVNYFALLFSTTIPPLADYPNHLARIHINANWLGDEHIRRYYLPFWQLQPNLAFDAFGYLLLQWTDAYTAGRIIGSLTILSLIGGASCLHRAASGRWSIPPFLVGFLAVSRFYHWGFLGYLLTLGLGFLAFGWWLTLSPRPKLQFAVGITVATLLYLGHLFAFAVYGICVVASDWQRRWDSGRLWELSSLSVLGQLLPAVALYGLARPKSTDALVLAWDFPSKLKAPVVLTPGFDLPPELAILIPAAAITAVLIGMKAIVVRPYFLAPIASLLVVFALMPSHLMNSWNADRRLLLPIAMLILCSLEWGMVHPRVRAAAVLSLGCLLALLQVHLFRTWRMHDSVAVSARELLRQVEPGAGVASVVFLRGPEFLASPVHELATLAVIERSALVPNIFSYPAEPATAVRYQADYQNCSSRRGLIHVDGRRNFNAVAYLVWASKFAPNCGYRYALVLDTVPQPLPVPAGYREIASTPGGEARLYSLPEPGAQGGRRQRAAVPR